MLLQFKHIMGLLAKLKRTFKLQILDESSDEANNVFQRLISFDNRANENTLNSTEKISIMYTGKTHPDSICLMSF